MHKFGYKLLLCNVLVLYLYIYVCAYVCVDAFARKYLHAYVYFMEINYVAAIWQHF